MHQVIDQALELPSCSWPEFGISILSHQCKGPGTQLFCRTYLQHAISHLCVIMLWFAVCFLMLLVRSSRMLPRRRSTLVSSLVWSWQIALRHKCWSKAKVTQTRWKNSKGNFGPIGLVNWSIDQSVNPILAFFANSWTCCSWEIWYPDEMFSMSGSPSWCSPGPRGPLVFEKCFSLRRVETTVAVGRSQAVIC